MESPIAMTAADALPAVRPTPSPSPDVVLLTGATGYVGGRLPRALERAGTPVRCLARRPEALVGRVGESTKVVAGDLLDGSTLAPAMAGTTVAYYPRALDGRAGRLC